MYLLKKVTQSMVQLLQEKETLRLVWGNMYLNI